MSRANGSKRPHERVAQKLRTRQALLEAARRLVAEGRTPSVAEAADAALVSRATAYRYFPTQEALLVELPLDVAAPTVASLFAGADAPKGAEDRAALVQNALYDLARDHEAQFRLFLRSSLLRSLGELDSDGDPFRGARRAALLDAALEPLESTVPSAELRRLKVSLSMAVGIEPMIVLRDVLHLDHDDARAEGERTVRELVRNTIARHSKGGVGRAPRA